MPYLSIAIHKLMYTFHGYCSMKEYNIQTCIYLVDKLDGVLEDREETRQTEVGHFLHDWIRIHLETPATSSPVV